MAPPLPGLLYAQAREYQDRLAVLEEGAADELARYWVQAQATIQRDLDALLARVGEATANGERLSPSWAFRETRYRQALATAQEQADLFGRTAARVVTATQETAATMAATSSASLGSAALASAQVGATFTGVNPDNLRHLAGFLADGSPVADLLGSLGQDALPRLRQVLSDGIVLGRGVDRIRRDVLAAVDVPRWRADTIVRTESHRVFRAASTETYAANADVLTGWTWLAALDSRTCPGCIAMHGTVHPVDTPLRSHPRCRCTQVPLPVGSDMRLQPGTEWLAAQPVRTQRAVLGPGKFAAYQDGRLDLSALARRTDDPVWGPGRREATLAEALDESARIAAANVRTTRNTRRRRV